MMGAGGGLVLIPLLSMCDTLDERELFPASLSIMAPICVISILLFSSHHRLPWQEAIPYLIGSSIGGIFAGINSCRIPVLWLHRILGILILWGGIRYLC